MTEAGGHHLVGQQRDEHRVPVGSQRSHRHERVHVRLAVTGSAPGGHQETPAEHELDDGGRYQEPAIDLDHRPGRTPGSEHDRHHRHADSERDDRPGQQLAAFVGTLGRIGIGRLGRVPGRGVATDVVARGMDGRNDAGAVDHGGVEADGGALGGEIDIRLGHAIGAAEVALDAVHAARAGHANHGQRELGHGFGGWRGHRSQHTTGEYPAGEVEGPRGTRIRGSARALHAPTADIRVIWMHSLASTPTRRWISTHTRRTQSALRSSSWWTMTPTRSSCCATSPGRPAGWPRDSRTSRAFGAHSTREDPRCSSWMTTFRTAAAATSPASSTTMMAWQTSRSWYARPRIRCGRPRSARGRRSSRSPSTLPRSRRSLLRLIGGSPDPIATGSRQARLGACAP